MNPRRYASLIARGPVVALGASTLILAGVLVSGCGGSDSASSASASSTTAAPAVNVTLTTKNAVLHRDANGVTRLVLTGYSPTAEETAVSPGRSRVEVPTSIWARGWKAQYKGYEPNSVLVYESGGKMRRLSFALADGAYNPVKGQMAFTMRPLATGATKEQRLTSVGEGAGRTVVLGPSTLFVDPLDFGSNTDVQDQAAESSLVQALSNFTISDKVLKASASSDGTSFIKALVRNGLSEGDAYKLLLLSGSSGEKSDNTAMFQGDPAFAGATFSAGNWTFESLGNSSVTFVVNENGKGGFTLSPDVRVDFNGMPNLTIFNGTYTSGTVTGELGPNSSIIGGNFNEATFDNFSTKDALIANADFSGATFTADGKNGTTSFKDSALLGVNFAKATLSDAIAFSGTSIVPFKQMNPNGDAPTVVNSSFEGQEGSTFIFGPSEKYTDVNARTPVSRIEDVSFANSKWDAFAVATADFTGAKFDGAELGRAQFKFSTFDSATTFKNADLGQASFTSSRLTGTDFSTTKFDSPVFEGSVNAPTVLSDVTFSMGAQSFAEGAGRPEFTNTVFDGVVFGGLQRDKAEDVAFVSSLIKGNNNSTERSGINAFGSKFVQGMDGFWYEQTGASEWTPLNPDTLEPNGEPVVNSDPQNPAPEPAPPADPAGGGAPPADPAGGDGNGGGAPVDPPADPPADPAGSGAPPADPPADPAGGEGAGGAPPAGEGAAGGAPAANGAP